MTVKYGEFNSAQMAPSWETKAKKASDVHGYKRGLKGGGHAKDDGDFVGTWNPKSDHALFGPQPVTHGRQSTKKPSNG